MPVRAVHAPGPSVTPRRLAVWGAAHAAAGAGYVATGAAFCLGVSMLAVIVPCVVLVWSRPTGAWLPRWGDRARTRRAG